MEIALDAFAGRQDVDKTIIIITDGEPWPPQEQKVCTSDNQIVAALVEKNIADVHLIILGNKKYFSQLISK